MKSQLISALHMINILFKDENYKEAFRGLILIKKTKPYGDDDTFDKHIDDLIDCCITKIKLNKFNSGL